MVKNYINSIHLRVTVHYFSLIIDRANKPSVPREILTERGQIRNGIKTLQKPYNVNVKCLYKQNSARRRLRKRYHPVQYTNSEGIVTGIMS